MQTVVVFFNSLFLILIIKNEEISLIISISLLNQNIRHFWSSCWYWVAFVSFIERFIILLLVMFICIFSTSYKMKILLINVKDQFVNLSMYIFVIFFLITFFTNEVIHKWPHLLLPVFLTL